MITLDVAFDDDLVTDCLTGPRALSAATWQRFCQSPGVPLLGESPDAFLSDRVLTAEEQREIGNHLTYLTGRRSTSIAHASPVFPDTHDDIRHDLTVAFVPLGKIMAGVRPGLQLFSLFPDACSAWTRKSSSSCTRHRRHTTCIRSAMRSSARRLRRNTIDSLEPRGLAAAATI